MAEASIPADLLNPGQVFACLGFLEAADGLCGEARGGFDWRGSDGVRFYLEASGSEGSGRAGAAFSRRSDRHVGRSGLFVQPHG